jgi:hypothetical protein
MIHYASQMEKFGPLFHSWTMRQESKLSFVKSPNLIIIKVFPKQLQEDISCILRHLHQVPRHLHQVPRHFHQVLRHLHVPRRVIVTCTHSI